MGCWRAGVGRAHAMDVTCARLPGESSEITHATGRSRELTADDLGYAMRVECIGAFGGDTPVSASSGVVELDEASKAEIAKLRKQAELKFVVRTASGNEKREIVVGKDKIKVRERGGRSGKTIHKQEWKGGVSVRLEQMDDVTFTLKLGAGACELQCAAPRPLLWRTCYFHVASDRWLAPLPHAC